MKIDFFKSVVIILLIALVFFMFKLSKTIEANAVENSKTGRFINIHTYVILDTKTGATYDISTEGKAVIQTPEIVK
jgi:hypothetical protein